MSEVLPLMVTQMCHFNIWPPGIVFDQAVNQALQKQCLRFDAAETESEIIYGNTHLYG